MSILINAVTFYFLANFLPGFKMKSKMAPIWASLLYVVVGILMLLGALPFLMPLFAGMAALGPLAFLPTLLIGYVVNVLILIVVDKTMEDFEMDSIKTALIAAFILSAVGFFSGRLLG